MTQVIGNDLFKEKIETLIDRKVQPKKLGGNERIWPPLMFQYFS